MNSTRGDVVMFPWRSHSGDFHDKQLFVGVVTSVGNTYILCDHTLVIKRILSIYIADKFEVVRFYPDKISDMVSTRFDDRCSFEKMKREIDWSTVRREAIADEIYYLHSRRDECVDVAEKIAAPISDLDLMAKARLLSTFKNIQSNISVKIEERSVIRPSIFRNKVSIAKENLITNRNENLLKCCFFKWEENMSYIRNLKSSSAVSIQKHSRRFLNRQSLDKQRRWKKWWTMHKDFNYISKSQQSYNVMGSDVYLPLKCSVEQWGTLMKGAGTVITKYALQNIQLRLYGAFRRWRECINQQEKEMTLMWNEEIHSFV
jgi:hypothetical protein